MDAGHGVAVAEGGGAEAPLHLSSPHGLGPAALVVRADHAARPPVGAAPVDHCTQHRGRGGGGPFL